MARRKEKSFTLVPVLPLPSSTLYCAFLFFPFCVSFLSMSYCKYVNTKHVFVGPCFSPGDRTVYCTVLSCTVLYGTAREEAIVLYVVQVHCDRRADPRTQHQGGFSCPPPLWYSSIHLECNLSQLLPPASYFSLAYPVSWWRWCFSWYRACHQFLWSEHDSISLFALIVTEGRKEPPGTYVEKNPDTQFHSVGLQARIWNTLTHTKPSTGRQYLHSHACLGPNNSLLHTAVSYNLSLVLFSFPIGTD